MCQMRIASTTLSNFAEQYLEIWEKQPNWCQQKRHQARLLCDAKVEVLWVICQDLTLEHIYVACKIVIYLHQHLQ